MNVSNVENCVKRPDPKLKPMMPDKCSFYSSFRQIALKLLSFVIAGCFPVEVTARSNGESTSRSQARVPRLEFNSQMPAWS